MSKPLDLTISIARLREALDYNPATGAFYWRISTGRVRSGQRAGTVSNGYVVINLDGVRYRAHRLAWAWQTGLWPAGEVDHKNTDRADNVWTNLRPASGTLNQANRGVGKNNRSGFKGVSWSRQKDCWRACISLKGRTIHIGLFETAEEASAAYTAKATELFGEFARA